MQGKIVKGIAGFYYVYTALGLFECKAKGIFRKEQKKPLVGDLVEMVPDPSGIRQCGSGTCDLCYREAGSQL